MYVLSWFFCCCWHKSIILVPAQLQSKIANVVFSLSCLFFLLFCKCYNSCRHVSVEFYFVCGMLLIELPWSVVVVPFYFWYGPYPVHMYSYSLKRVFTFWFYLVYMSCLHDLCECGMNSDPSVFILLTAMARISYSMARGKMTVGNLSLRITHYSRPFLFICAAIYFWLTYANISIDWRRCKYSPIIHRTIFTKHEPFYAILNNPSILFLHKEHILNYFVYKNIN